MRLAALVLVCGLMLGQEGGEGAAVQGSDSVQRTRATGSVLSALSRRTAGDFLEEDPSTCLSLRENEEQRQLLCNDRRSKFNFNAFGLRFGKRYDGYIFRRAVKRARTNKFSPLSLFSRELEVPT
uniref:kisspeptin 2 n=1 Tax=Semicossyphus pulcher TaxID=241346 RepID=UPI0037E977AB